MDKKIEVIQTLLKHRNHEVEEIKNGCRLKLKFDGQKCSVDFYTLLSAPDQIRAKVTIDGIKNTENSARLQTVQDMLEEALRGAAEVEKLSFFGPRGSASIFYARVLMDRDPQVILSRFEAAERAFTQLQGLDSKRFRKNLDQLGLPRSSTVRVALARIFRESIDAQELLATVDSEARKIVHSEQWRAIKEIRSKNQLSAANYIIDLLWEEISRTFIERAQQELNG
jgi:hypothetical protein